jgi:hypothetical protein
MVLWLLIPLGSYPTDPHLTVLPSWFTDTENRLIAFREWSQSSAWGRLARVYFSVTGQWQHWFMFAPNPPLKEQVLIVRATTLKEGKPEVDPVPVYKSFDYGVLVAAQFAQSRWKPILPAYAQYWGRVYEQEKGVRPASIEIALFEKPLALADAGKEAEEKVLWSGPY